MSSRRLGNVRHARRPARKSVGQQASVGISGWKPACQIVVVLAFEVVISPPIAVKVGNVLDHIFIGHSLCAPGPTVAADFAAYVEVVEQHETLCQGVLVWGHVVPKQDQTRVAVPLRQIAKHLIVSAVLFYYVDHMLDSACPQPDTGQSLSILAL